MGLSPFSKSYFDTNTDFKSPNPDPNNYRIISYSSYGSNLVVEILYPDATNYEGRKILVFRNTTIDDLKRQRTIDPHFSENKSFKSPFARFEPTNLGRFVAEELARIL